MNFLFYRMFIGIVGINVWLLWLFVHGHGYCDFLCLMSVSFFEISLCLWPAKFIPCWSKFQNIEEKPVPNSISWKRNPNNEQSEKSGQADTANFFWVQQLEFWSHRRAFANAESLHLSCDLRQLNPCNQEPTKIYVWYKLIASCFTFYIFL